MICVEQKHHSTQSLDPRPGAICKTLQSNTRASYDPRQGSSAEKTHPGRVSEVKSNLSRSVCEGLWHKKGPLGRVIAREIVGEAVAPQKRTINIRPKGPESSLFTGWVSLSGGFVFCSCCRLLSASTCSGKSNTNIQPCTKQTRLQNVARPLPRPPLWWTVIQRFGLQRLVHLRGTLVTTSSIWVVFSLASSGVWRSKSCETGGSWLINNKSLRDGEPTHQEADALSL